MTAATLADGVYFDLPEEIYFAIPRLSGSGIQNLAISAGTFWAGSWLNETKAAKLRANALAAGEMFPTWCSAAAIVAAELAALHPGLADTEVEAEPEESTKAQLLGKAYHCARFEPDSLDSRFAREPTRADFPATRDGEPTLWTGKDIEAALAGRDLPKKTTADRGVADQGRRLIAAGYAGVVFPVETADFQDMLKGRIPIRGDLWDAMLTDVERMRSQPEVAALLRDGFGEVVILYTGPRGIPMKARIDFLKADAWADFKTFDNSQGKNLLQVISERFRYSRHYMQAVIYREAVEMLRANALPIMSDATDAQRALIARIAMAPEELACWYVYQEKNGIPNILARRVRFFDVPLNVQIQHAGASAEGIAAVEDATRSPTFWHRRAIGEIGRARTDFVNYQEIYEPGRPWLPVRALGEFTDDDFPTWWLEERPD